MTQLEALGGFYFTPLYYLMIHLDPQISRNHISCISGGVTHLLQNSAVCVAAEHVLQ